MNIDTRHWGAWDFRLLFWLGVWSIGGSIAVGVIVGTNSNYADNENTMIALSAAIGVLVSAWNAMLTWVFVADLPNKEDPQQQRMAPRICCGITLAINIAVLMFFCRAVAIVLFQIGSFVLVANAGPLVVWQWTKRRISRAPTIISSQTSIWQLMIVTSISATAFAGASMCFKEVTSVAFMASVLFSAVVWLGLLVLLLGNCWWLYPLLLIFQFFCIYVVILLIDQSNIQAVRETSGLGTMMTVSFIFSTLFVLLMRSSGHRWLIIKKRAVQTP